VNALTAAVRRGRTLPTLARYAAEVASKVGEQPVCFTAASLQHMPPRRSCRRD
jgi:hypothetical protein